MSIYKVTFGDGSWKYVRASTPKEAWERADIAGLVVSHVKFVR
jgi:hypothetical protein